MTRPTPHHDVFTTAFRNYWWISTLGGLYFVVGFVLWGGTRAAVVSSSIFVVVAACGLALHYLAPSIGRPRRVALIVAHLLIAQLVLVWQQTYLPLTDYTATGDPQARVVLVYLVSTLALCALSMFGGLWVAALGLLLHYGFIFDRHQEFSFTWVFPVLIAMAGAIVSSALWKLDAAYRQLEDLASLDSLTGLLNRSRLSSEFDRLQQCAVTESRPFLVVAWDLDDLKVVNDTRGHAAGDTYLRTFATALRAHLRRDTQHRAGDAAFRVGGDEFISLHLDIDDGQMLLDRVHTAFASVSAGWTRSNTLTLDQALTQADAALYATKERRKQLLTG